MTIKEIKAEGKDYGSLDAGRYLEAMEQDTEKQREELGKDAVPRPFIPWRRFLARYLDWAVYETVWQIFLVAVLNQNIGSRSGIEPLFDIVMGLILMAAIEPVLLSVCATTFGKWILGIRVTDNEGRKLSYASALERTIKVLWFGMRVRIPIYELWGNYKCYLMYANGETLEWEWESELTVKDEAYWRIGAMVACYVATVVALVVGVSYGEFPKNRGDITVAEFAQNYNHYMDYLELDSEYKLGSDGTWQKVTSDTVIYVYFDGEMPRPEFVFTEENGFMTGVSFEAHLEDYDMLWSAYGSERIVAVMAFILAQDDVDVEKREVKELISRIQERPFESFSYEAYGVAVACEISCSGYEVVESSEILFAQEGADTEYSIRFTMQK